MDIDADNIRKLFNVIENLENKLQSFDSRFEDMNLRVEEINVQFGKLQNSVNSLNEIKPEGEGLDAKFEELQTSIDKQFEYHQDAFDKQLTRLSNSVELLDEKYDTFGMSIDTMKSYARATGRNSTVPEKGVLRGDSQALLEPRGSWRRERLFRK